MASNILKKGLSLLFILFSLNGISQTLPDAHMVWQKIRDAFEARIPNTMDLSVKSYLPFESKIAADSLTMHFSFGKSGFYQSVSGDETIYTEGYYVEVMPDEKVILLCKNTLNKDIPNSMSFLQLLAVDSNVKVTVEKIDESIGVLKIYGLKFETPYIELRFRMQDYRLISGTIQYVEDYDPGTFEVSGYGRIEIIYSDWTDGIVFTEGSYPLSLFVNNANGIWKASGRYNGYEVMEQQLLDIQIDPKNQKK